MVLILRTRFRERFQVAEHAHVERIDLTGRDPVLLVRSDEGKHFSWSATYVVLCTN
jgi:hypothetical protein